MYKNEDKCQDTILKNDKIVEFVGFNKFANKGGKGLWLIQKHV